MTAPLTVGQLRAALAAREARVLGGASRAAVAIVLHETLRGADVLLGTYVGGP